MFVYVARTIIIYLLVMFSMRLMGKRQLGELQPSELVSTFLISNLASICIEDTVQPLVSSVVPVLIIAVLEIFNSALCYLFPGYARLLGGKPVAVVRQGQIDQAALRELRISGSDLIEALRGKDLFSPEDIMLAVVEPNGTLSIYPAKDENGQPPLLPIVVDGAVLRDNLNLLQKDEAWLRRQLSRAEVPLKQVYLYLNNGQADEGSSLLVRKKEV